MRYDQRVLVLIEVRGPERDVAQAREEFAARGWPVLADVARGTGFSAGVLDAEPDTPARLFSVEVRLFGARNKRTEQAAAWRVQQLARDSVLEMYVRRTELVVRDVKPLPEWWVWIGQQATGSVTTGTEQEARGLARMDMPGGAPVRKDAEIHQPPRRGLLARYAMKREERIRVVVLLLGSLMAVGLGLRFASQQEGFPRWFWATCALGFLLVGMGQMSKLGRALGGGGLTQAGLGGMYGAVACGLAGFGFLSLSAKGAALIVAVPTIGIGLWLLVRQWNRSEWIAWAVPLLATLTLTFLVASATVQHALYANRLALPLDDLNVLPIGQVASGARVIGLLSLVLILPALWGIAKHLHLPSTRPGERIGVVLFAPTLLIYGLLGALLLTQSASDAAEQAIDAAENRRKAPEYYGVRPLWMCVQPTVPRNELNEQGGVLDPSHPYLSFTVTGERITAWNTETNSPLRIPSDQVRLVPAADPDRPCSRQESEPV
ncbi:NnrS multi-domain protein [Streptomyces sp. NBC_00105]|uniref:NnrS multi-domain protein n=1 Tax=unclassified Streptomyces TaxID=2593676 RepID=UPI002883FE6D|nr:NnrS multi-domain protein [Streptomyces sp. DSM 41633]